MFKNPRNDFRVIRGQFARFSYYIMSFALVLAQPVLLMFRNHASESNIGIYDSY